MTSETTITRLLDTYDGILLDAYGVLVDGSGVLPAAAPLFAELGRRGKPFAIVTNDASRSQATYVRRFAGYGIEIAPERFVTSGSLLPAYFQARGLAGARTLVLGTQDSCDFVRAGGGVPVDVQPGIEVDAVAICDDSGTPFLAGIEIALSAIVRAVEAGRRPVLVVPNPDLVYPKSSGELGFTAGAMALLVEQALARRFPEARLRFDHLGKPEPHMFVEAARRLGIATDRLVMIGDQLETDIAGGRAAGVATALLAGVSRWDGRSDLAPTYLLGTIVP
jgi:HAD superfamily hydrolase (TIGR01450 family)